MRYRDLEPGAQAIVALIVGAVLIVPLLWTLHNLGDTPWCTMTSLGSCPP